MPTVRGDDYEKTSSQLGAHPPSRTMDAKASKMLMEETRKHLLSQLRSTSLLDSPRHVAISKSSTVVTTPHAPMREKRDVSQENFHQSEGAGNDNLSWVRWLPSMIRLYERKMSKETEMSNISSSDRHNSLPSSSPRSVLSITDHGPISYHNVSKPETQYTNKLDASLTSTSVPSLAMHGPTTLLLIFNDNFGKLLNDPYTLVRKFWRRTLLECDYKRQITGCYENLSKKPGFPLCNLSMSERALLVSFNALRLLEDNRIDAASELYKRFIGDHRDSLENGEVFFATMLHNLGLLNLIDGKGDISRKYYHEAIRVRAQSQFLFAGFDKEEAVSNGMEG